MSSGREQEPDQKDLVEENPGFVPTDKGAYLEVSPDEAVWDLDALESDRDHPPRCESLDFMTQARIEERVDEYYLTISTVGSREISEGMVDTRLETDYEKDRLIIELGTNPQLAEVKRIAEQVMEETLEAAERVCRTSDQEFREWLEKEYEPEQWL